MALDLLLRIGPAIQVIFDLGFEPRERFFHELTPEQYLHLGAQGQDVSRTWYALIPDAPGCYSLIREFIGGSTLKIPHND